MLYRLGAFLRARFKDDKLLLSDYFDLISGTSTGAIIAAGLVLGMTVEQIEKHYLDLGEKVFGPRTLASNDFRTGLLVVSKRFDTGSTWAVTNNDRAKYFKARPGATAIPNGEYPLWQVLRASTAAPTFFDPEMIRIPLRRQSRAQGSRRPVRRRRRQPAQQPGVAVADARHHGRLRVQLVHGGRAAVAGVVGHWQGQPGAEPDQRLHTHHRRAGCASAEGHDGRRERPGGDPDAVAVQ